MNRDITRYCAAKTKTAETELKMMNLPAGFANVLMGINIEKIRNCFGLEFLRRPSFHQDYIGWELAHDILKCAEQGIDPAIVLDGIEKTGDRSPATVYWALRILERGWELPDGYFELACGEDQTGRWIYETLDIGGGVDALMAEIRENADA